jgi:hypothetical protein
VTAVWAEAEEITSGKRGSYPFDEAGKRRILGDLALAGREIDALGQKGLLSEAEAGLLKLDLEELTGGVQAHRPTELLNATCYMPGVFVPFADNVSRLSQRLPLLEKLLDGPLQPAVVHKTLVAVETDLRALSDPDLPRQAPDLAKEARDLLGRLKPLVARVRKRLGGEATRDEEPPSVVAWVKGWFRGKP